jgi:competence protein ComEA
MPRNHLLTALALLVAGAIGLSQLGSSDPAPAAPSAPPAIRMDESGPAAKVLVHVAGAVRRPGVYRLREGMRVDDALQLAGGPTRRADLAAVNLAAKVQDGRQVLVPERVRAGGRAPGTAGAGAATGSTGAGAAAGVPVNLNTATLEQLDTLDGIGPATAQSIIDFREERGGFGSVEELGEIPGIGEKRLATLRESVTV